MNLNINDMTDIEIWKTAVYDGEVYEGLYKVSNWGRILSLNYRNTGRPGLMNPGERKDGYLQVVLCKNGKRVVFIDWLLKPFYQTPRIYHKLIIRMKTKQITLCF